MTAAPLRLLATWLALAIILGLMAWRFWRHGQTRFSALEAALFECARRNRVHHTGGNYPRNLAPKAHGLAEVVAGRLAGCLAAALLHVRVGVWHASYRLHRPDTLGRPSSAS